jgi:aminomuconate-semialdehyde/2-hydroxymuconate-6-semialdehyde dehydrogenase
LASPRFYVERSRYDWFVKEFLSRVEKIKVGNPLAEDTKMGALISFEHRNKVESYLKKVNGEGRILCGGNRPFSQGYFLNPTVITGLSEKHPVTKEEIFGPVVSIYPFDKEEDVIKAVNSTPYGLSCSVWTNDKSKADRVVAEVKMGLVWVNCWFVRDLRVPFGGQKKSGIGREGGRWSLDFFSEWKSVCEKS